MHFTELHRRLAEVECQIQALRREARTKARLGIGVEMCHRAEIEDVARLLNEDLARLEDATSRVAATVEAADTTTAVRPSAVQPRPPNVLVQAASSPATRS